MAVNEHLMGTGLRARLEGVGAVIGIPVHVTDDEVWELTDRELRVGLGWYGVRGHSESEAVALAFLHLWEGPRNNRVEPARARRRASFTRVRPDATPLFDAVYRVQAMSELLTAMPGLRAPLLAATCRSVPSDVTTWPRHLQWIAVVLRAGVAGAADAHTVLAGTHIDVRRAWSELLPIDAHRDAIGRAEHEMLDQLRTFRRVMAPDSKRSAVLRFERAVAWLLGAYEQLAARDAAERGLDAHSGAGGADDEPAPETALSSSGQHAGDGDADAEGDERDGDEPDQDPDASDGDGETGETEEERARAGDGRETAEGADLFASQQAAFVERMLSTPMPGGGRTDDRGLMPEAPPPANDSAQPAEPLHGASGGSAGGFAETELADYRGRAASLADAIERMRAVWAQVIAERVTSRRVPDARPRPEGDDLAADSLAAAVAESRAGQRRPRAFRDRAMRARRTRRAGSTDYVLLLDRSASMQGAAAEAAADTMLIMTEALAGVARDIEAAERVGGAALDLDIRTALVVFDSAVDVVKPLSSGLDDSVRRAVHGAIRVPRGSTNDGAALRAAADQLGLGESEHSDGGAANGRERRRIVILVSDGGSNDPTAAEHALRRLRSAGVEVHGIGIGPGDLESRYAPNGRTVLDVRTLPEVLQSLVLDEVERRTR
ncbi:vWA domain-containing protein [Leucobacter sp. L43]|uniref:vWA domain-containing protein n=1 Tax=Leucobacter sp. L43 TaxID=2798040 RepID=UPI00190745F9|nr:vWA domain-containing protein [Leucobacter sp. L43]